MFEPFFLSSPTQRSFFLLSVRVFVSRKFHFRQIPFLFSKPNRSRVSILNRFSTSPWNVSRSANIDVGNATGISEKKDWPSKKRDGKLSSGKLFFLSVSSCLYVLLFVRFSSSRYLRETNYRIVRKLGDTCFIFYSNIEKARARVLFDSIEREKRARRRGVCTTKFLRTFHSR